MLILRAVFPEGGQVDTQPLALRAPEVYEGFPCVSRSSVWACAAMMLCWLKPGILGDHDQPYDMPSEPWCIAKLMRFFPDGNWNPSDEKIPQLGFKIARQLVQRPELQVFEPLSSSLKQEEIPREWSEFLLSLLVIEVEKRPTAKEALSSREYMALAQQANEIATT